MSAPFHQSRRAREPAQTTPATRVRTRGRIARWLVTALLIVSGLLTFGYAGVSTYIATNLAYVAQKPLTGSPSDFGLAYTYVSFPARDDGLQIKGWFIPGVLPNGRLTTDRTLVVVHGNRTNRTDPSAGILDLSAVFAKHGFAVLAFDMRGTGESSPYPLSLSVYEQRDVLGAVDFLQSGKLPYPALGRPRVIAGYGASLGGGSLISAAAKDTAIRAVVADSAAADYVPILQREIPKQSGLPAMFTPGALAATWALYGVNFGAARPVDDIAGIAPRPIFLIHGSADDYIPPSNMAQLYTTATSAPNAHVQEWLVQGAKHVQSYHTAGNLYVTRVVAFYTQALGRDQSAARSARLG